MKKKKIKKMSMSKQIKKRIKNADKESPELWSPPRGTDRFLLSTGSTLVDLAISGRRFKGGGIPMGIFCEIFGASSRGKTVILLEMAGNVQRMGGDYLFLDPEARVNEEFGKVFDFDLESDKYKKPDTVEEAFDYIRSWKQKGEGPHVIFSDGLAAFASKEESEGKGDEYSGARKAKEFSQEFRKTCRIIENRNYLFVATNQIRQIMGATAFQKKTKATGGNAPEYYASLRLELLKPAKDSVIKEEKTVRGVKHKQSTGVTTKVYVDKSTVSAPHKSGEMRILFDYGIDDIVTNLVYMKRNTKSPTYILDGKPIGSSLKDAIKYIEHPKEKVMRKRVKMLKNDVIDLWTEIQRKFVPNRRRKIR